MSNMIYRIIAFKEGKKRILCEYYGDDTGMYDFQIERVEKTSEDCCSEKDVPCDEENCTCTTKCCG